MSTVGGKWTLDTFSLLIPTYCCINATISSTLCGDRRPESVCALWDKGGTLPQKEVQLSTDDRQPATLMHPFL